MRKLLEHMSMRYPNISLSVAGVSLPTDNDDIRDTGRVDVIRAYADEVLKGE